MMELEKSRVKLTLGSLLILALVLTFLTQTSAVYAQDPTSTLTVDLAGLSGIRVEIYQGDTLIAAYDNQGGAKTYTVPQAMLDVVLKQGPKTLTVSNLDCTGGTCDAGDVTETLTVDLTGLSGIRVELHLNDNASGSAGDQIWAQDNQSGLKTYTVLKNTYDVVLKQGPKTKIVDAVDCDGDSCNAGPVTAQLTVDLTGLSGIRVELYLNGGAGNPGALIWAQDNQSGVRTYTVLRNTYDVMLRQGPKTLTVAHVGCEGETCNAGDVTETLTVDLTGLSGIRVELHLNDNASGSAGALIWAQDNQSGLKTYTVLKNTYDVVLKQGPKTKIVDAVDCDGDSCNAGPVTAQLTVDLTGLSGIRVELHLHDGAGSTGDQVWAQDNQSGVRKYTVLRNTYDVVLKQGPKALTVDQVDCTGEICDAGDVTETLTVDLSGLSGIRVELHLNDNASGSAGDLIWAQDNQSGPRTYTVLKNTYDVVLKQGPKTKIVDVVDCDGETCNAGPVTAQLTVDLTGLSGIRVELYLNGGAGNPGALIWAQDNQSGVRTYTVLRNTYDVMLRQGPKTLTVPGLPCESGTCDAGDVTATLTVDLTGLSGIRVELHLEDVTPGSAGALIWAQDNQSGLKTYTVLRNTYDVVLKQGPKVKVVDGVGCTGDTCTAGPVTAQLTIVMTGFSGVRIELHLDDGLPGSAGAIIWAQDNQSGTRTYTVLRNTYDVMLKYASQTFLWDAVDCSGATCTLDKSTLKVNFPGISSVHVYVRQSDGKAGIATGQEVANQTYKNDSAVFTNLPNGKYDVVLVKNAKTKIVDDVIVLGSNATLDNIVATLTVKFPGISGVHTYVKVDDGKDNSATGGDVENRTYKTDETSMAVLKNTYDVVVVKNAKIKTIDAVDCTGDTCTVDNIVATLTVKFPGISGVHTYVKVNDSKPDSATGGDVDNRTYKDNSTSLAVLKNTYDVKVVKNAKTKIIDAVDCTGDTCTVDGIVATLTVKFPGISGVHTYVKVPDGIANSATGGDVDNRTYKDNETALVVLKNTYDVKVVKGAKTKIIDAVDCTGDTCLVDGIVATLTVKFPGISSVHTYVKVPDGAANSATGGDVDNRTYKDNSTSLAVLKNTYDVVVMKGAKTKIMDAVDCTGDTCTVDNIVATLTVKFPGISGAHTYVKVPDGIDNSATGGDVENRTYQNNETSMAVLKNFYDVKIVKGSDSYIYDNVNCTGDTCTLDKATLSVKFPGISSVHVYVRESDGAAGTATGKQVAAQTYKTDVAVFGNLPNGVYDVVLVKGAKTKIVDAVIALGGWATVDDIVATLTVNFPGISSVHTYVKVNDGVADSATGGNVESRTYKTDETSMAVLKNTYDVMVVKGTKTKIVDAVNCTGDTCTVDNIVATMTVKFPGISSVHTYVKVNDGKSGEATGGNVESRTYKTDETSMAVLKNTYDVMVVKGAKTKIVDAVNCTGDTCTVDNIVATLTVKFPGISSVHTYVKVNDGKSGEATGGNVESRTYKTDETSMAVLKNTYDVVVVKGAKTKIVDAVNCTGDTCTVDNIVATLTVKFPGISSVHTYVKVVDGTPNSATGGNVESRTYKTDETSMAVLKNTYDVVVVKGAKTKIMDGVDCTGDTCTVDNIVATLTVSFPGISSVHTYVKVDDGKDNSATGGNVESRTYKTDETSMAVLKNTYDVVVVKGAKTKIIDAVNCTGDTCTVDNIVATLTVKFPGISSVHTYVKVDDGKDNSATGGNVDSRVYQNNQTSLAVLKGTYDVKVVKGAKTKIIDAVNCTGDTCTVDGIVATLTVSFPGKSSVHTYVKVDDGSANSAAGGNVDSRTYKADETSMAVLKNTYDVVVKIGSDADIVDAVDCTGNVCWMQILNLVGHDGSGVAGGKATPAFGGSWGAQCAGQTNAKGRLWCALTNPNFTKFRMTYNQGSVEQLLVQLNTTKYTWQTVEAVIELQDHSGSGLSGGKVDQGGGYWQEHGYTGLDGKFRLEMFPGTYKFRMGYNHTSQEKSQDISTPVVFQTGYVVSAGTAIRASLGGTWVAYTPPGMELLPGTYQFVFAPPTLSPQSVTVTAGTVTNVP